MMVSPKTILLLMLVCWCRGTVTRSVEECSHYFHRYPTVSHHEDILEHEILCYVGGTPSYHVTTVAGRYYNMFCKSNNVLNEENLPLAQLKCEGGPLKSYFLFSDCSLPSTSYADVMRHLGVAAIPNLMIRRLRSSSDPIQRRHLQGLDEFRTKVLNLYNNDIRDIPEDLFQDVPNLLMLELSTNKLRLPGRVFKYLKKLRVLMASNTELTNIPEDLFALPALEELFLDRNFLNLTSHTFHGATSLKTLYLGSNSLRTLPQDVFRELKNLMEVDLRNNPLTALPRGLFKHNKKMEQLLMDPTSESLKDALYELKKVTGCDFVENSPGHFDKRCNNKKKAQI